MESIEIGVTAGEGVAHKLGNHEEWKDTKIKQDSHESHKFSRRLMNAFVSIRGLASYSIQREGWLTIHPTPTELAFAAAFQASVAEPPASAHAYSPSGRQSLRQG